MSTQDRAVRGGEPTPQEGLEGEGAAAVGGRLEPVRLRAMQRRWIQRKAGGAGGAVGGGAAAIPSGGGAPLGGGVQARMEKTLGAELSGVRVHTGSESAEAAQSLGARAFTVGSDVHFGHGEFAPGSKEGDRLLAHELTHVVQGQQSGVQRKPDAAHADSDGAGGGEHADHEAAGHEVSEPGDPAEQEADKMGDHAADALHGAGDKSGGGHDVGGHGAENDAGAAGKKVAPQKPTVAAAAPTVGRKIFLAKDAAKSAPSKTSAGAKPAGAQPKALPPAAQTRIQVINKALDKDVTDRVLAVTLKSAQADLDSFVKEYPDDATIKDLKARFDGKKLAVETAFKVAITTATATVTKIDATKPESYDAYDALVKDPALLNWIGHPLFASHELVTTWVKARDDKSHAFAEAKKNALLKAKTNIGAAPDKSESRDTLDGILAAARPYLQSKSPYWPALAAEVQDAYVAKLEAIGTAEHAEQERKAKEREKAQHEKPTGGTTPSASAGATSGPLAPKATEQKSVAAATSTPGGNKQNLEAHAPGSKDAGKNDQKAPVPPAPAAPPSPAAVAHDAAEAHSASASPPAHPQAAAVEAKGHEGAKAHDGAKKHDEEEQKLKEEERRKNEEEQLEAEIELLCQQALHHIAEGNAAVGAACDIGAVAFPPAATVLHPVSALKSLGAAALSLRAEYQEKWLSLAIKHMTPEQIESALQRLQSEITTIGGLRKVVEDMISEVEVGKIKHEMKKKPKKDPDAKPELDENGDEKKTPKHAPRSEVVGSVAKGEGGELSAEAGGTVGVHLVEALAESVGEGAGASILESLGHMMHNVLPWLGTGLAAEKVRTTGEKIKDLKRKLWVLQELGKDVGAKTGKPVELPA